MPWDQSYTRSVSMSNDNEKIMVLTDLHFHGVPDEDMEIADKLTIAKEIKNYNPNLILVLGDSIDDHSNPPDGFAPKRWYDNQRDFINFMDTFKVPWAPIFGNHETSKGHGSSTFDQQSKPELAKLFASSKYCLFEWGPCESNWQPIDDGQSGGAGNYVINLTRGGRIIHSFIMMDTCQGTSWQDCYTAKTQIDWYQWMMYGLISMTNKDPMWTATLCTHVPFESFKDFSKTDTDKCHYMYGSNEGGVDAQKVHDSIDFWPIIVNLGHIDQIICGHDHENDSSFIHKSENIRLTYAVKSRRNWNNDSQTDKDWDPSMLGFLGMTISFKNEVWQENHLTSFS